MLGFKDKEIYCDTNTKYDFDIKEYTFFKKEFEKLRYTSLNEHIESVSYPIPEYYFYSHKFLNQISRVHDISKEKVEIGQLEFGRLSKNFKLINNITKDEKISHKQFGYIAINRKFDIYPNNDNSLFFLTKPSDEDFFDTENYNPDHKIIMNATSDINISNISKIDNFFIFHASLISTTFDLDIFANYNIDLIIKYSNYIIENRNGKFNLFIYTIIPITTKYSKLIDELHTKFEKVYICTPNAGADTPFIIIYCKNSKSNKPINMVGHASEQIINVTQFFNKKLYEIIIKINKEILLINEMANNISNLYEVFGIFQLVLLQDSIKFLENYNLPISKYYLYLFNELKINNDIKNIDIKFPGQLNLLFKTSNKTNFRYKYLCDLLDTIQIKIDHKVTFKINIQNISNGLDIEFLDLASNNFIFSNSLNFLCKQDYYSSTEKILKYYNYSYSSSKIQKYDLIITDQYDITDKLNIELLKLGGMLIVRINILDNSNYSYLEFLTSFFTNRAMYAPVYNQITNNFVYLILSDNKNYKINNIIDLNDTISSYILSNKIVMMYYCRLYGVDTFLKKYTKYLLNYI